MKKLSTVKSILEIGFRKKFNLRNLTKSHPFVKRNLLFLEITFILLFVLIVAISWFYISIVGEEEATTSIDLGGEYRSYKLTSDSFISILYIPQENDEILFNLGFENSGEDRLANFTIFV